MVREEAGKADGAFRGILKILIFILKVVGSRGSILRWEGLDL